MTDLGGLATNAEGEEERIISNIESLPERTGEYVSSRVEPQRDLLGNKVEVVRQLDESDISEVGNGDGSSPKKSLTWELGRISNLLFHTTTRHSMFMWIEIQRFRRCVSSCQWSQRNSISWRASSTTT